MLILTNKAVIDPPIQPIGTEKTNLTNPLFRNKKKAGPPSISAPAPAAAAKVGVPGTAAEILSLAIKSSEVGLHAYAFRWVLHKIFSFSV